MPENIKIKKPRKNSSVKSGKPEFVPDEKILKDEKDEKIIAVNIPEHIKNFGKRDKKDKEKTKEPGFDEVFTPFSSIPPVNAEGIPLNQDAMLNVSQTNIPEIRNLLKKD